VNVASSVMPLWRDQSATPDRRAADLLSRMTLPEKLSQLYGVWVGADSAGGDVAPHQHDMSGEPPVWEDVIADGLGQLTRPFGTAPIDPAVGAASLAHSQRQIMAANRFGIPAQVHEECLTGLAAWRATVFPAPLCWGATFDPDLIEDMGRAIGGHLRQLGVHQGLAPVLDVVRDLRWGRVEETIGEDPLLVGTIGSAYVRGLESAGIVATLKHFVGYSASTGGRNLAPVSIGPREFSDVLLPPFEMAIRAGARSVMNSYTSLDGVPSAADPHLLTDTLRGELGFTGTVVADYFSVAFLHTLHGVAGSLADAARLALTAGIDVELPTVHSFGEPLRRAVEDGTIDEAAIDRAVRHVLRQKCEIGLLDADYDPEPHGAIDLDSAESQDLARRVASRSVVLLHNPGGTLPLPPGRRVAVVGPRAHTPQAMLGCYSFPMHVGIHHPEVPIGVEIATLLSALTADPAGYQVTFAPGGAVQDATDEDIAEAARVAAQSEVCIAVLGDQAGLFGRGTSGEGCDATDLRLPGRQEELLEALIATGTPVVVVLLVGRPYELSRQLDRLAAVVCGFFPGQQGAQAIADVLGGRVNPSGRLPVSFPRAEANQPSTYLTPRLGHRSEVSTVDPTPLFPFGFGLAYRSATWLSVQPLSTQWPTDGTWTVQVTLRGDAESATSEVVQVYLSDPVAEVARPLRYLVAAPRVDLEPGDEKTVHVTVHADAASYTGIDLRRRVDPGVVTLHVGTSAAHDRATFDVAMTGPTRFVGRDRVLQPTVVVETDEGAARVR
jgi:beta-glucosidase